MVILNITVTYIRSKTTCQNQDYFTWLWSTVSVVAAVPLGLEGPVAPTEVITNKQNMKATLKSMALTWNVTGVSC